MILKEVNFNEIRKKGYRVLSIMQNGKCLCTGFIGDVLRQIPHLAENEIKEQRTYFEEWVIELN